MNRPIVPITLSLLLCLASGQASALAESPMKALRRTNQQLNALLRQQANVGEQSPKAKAVDERIKKTINRFLDFPELARLSLAKHWEARSPSEQKEFVSVLRDLIERNYVKQLRSQLDYKIAYHDEEVQGDTAKVETSVKVERDGRTEEVEIAYKMRKTKDGWMVFDVITDEVSIVRNYRSQFNRIIKRKSYDALIKKMRDKLETI
jgi:phospholipid transport system substrate-binding protein